MRPMPFAQGVAESPMKNTSGRSAIRFSITFERMCASSTITRAACGTPLLARVCTEAT